MRHSIRHLRSWLLVPLLAAGCTLSLPRDLAPLAGLDRCPRWDLQELARRAGEFSQATETETLVCALGELRRHGPAAGQAAPAGARICFLLADRTVRDQVRQERLAAEGVRWAEIAIGNGEEKNGAVHYYLATNLGLVVREHTALAMKNLKRLAHEMETACRLAPDEDRGGPCRVLGLLYLMAPPWPQGIGDEDKSLELLAQVVKAHPDHPLNHLYYARALWEIEEEDAREKVEEHLTQARRLILEGDWGQARERWLAELREIAAEAEFELPPDPAATS